MSTTTGNTSSKLPRITDQWGKYASNKNTVTTVSSGGTTITTTGKTQINIFNKNSAYPAPQRPGNIIYQGRAYNVPKHIWAQPYGMGGLNMGSIWGNLGSCCGSDPYKLTNWDRFYALVNGPISGPIIGSAALGLGGGLLSGLGQSLKGWFSGDSDKTDASSTKSARAEYEKFDGYDDIEEVEQYNDYIDSGVLDSKQTEANDAVKDFNENTKQINEQTPIAKQAKEAYDKCKGRIDQIKSSYPNLDSDISKLENKKDKTAEEESKLAELKKVKEELEKLEKDLPGLEETKNKEVKALQDLVDARSGLESAKTQKASELAEAKREASAKRKAARDAIRGKKSTGTVSSGKIDENAINDILGKTTAAAPAANNTTAANNATGTVTGSTPANPVAGAGTDGTVGFDQLANKLQMKIDDISYQATDVTEYQATLDQAKSDRDLAALQKLEQTINTNGHIG